MLPGPRKREACVVTAALRGPGTACQRTLTAQIDLKGGISRINTSTSVSPLPPIMTRPN